ncbi:MAG: tetratricopeptide repeat protein [Acidobacteriaceae bacterium]
MRDRRKPRHAGALLSVTHGRWVNATQSGRWGHRFFFLVLCTALLRSAPMLAQQALAAPGAGKPEVDALQAEGAALAAQQRFAEAEIPLGRALALAPGNVDLLRIAGKVEGRLGHMDEAVNLLQRAEALQPLDPQIHLELGIALADAENFPRALEEVSAAEKLEPGSGEAHLNRARILDRLGKAAEAEGEFAVAARLSPRNPDVFYYWALLESEEGRLGKESDLLERLTRLKPADDQAFYLLGRSFEQQGRRQESIAALRTVIRLNPESGEALYMLSRELRATHPAEAEKLSQRFLALRKKNADQEAAIALGNQGVEASRKNDWHRAIDLLRKALAACNGCAIEAGLHRDLGLTLCRNGQVDEGSRELHEALRLNPSDVDTVKALEVIGR